MKTGSISKTAQALGRTQPAVSLAIKNLEEAVGFKLFERQGRQLVAVPEAFYLMDEAKGILDRVATVRRTMNSLQKTEAGNLNIAAMQGPATYLFPHYISRMIGNNPEVSISFTSGTSARIYELVAIQSIDFGFVDLMTDARRSRQYFEACIRADCFCALPADHPLARQKDIALKDLDGIPMGVSGGNQRITKKIHDAFAQEDISFQQAVDSQAYLPMLQFVSTGRCLAIVDPLTVVTEQKINITQNKVVFRPLAQPLRYEYAMLSPNLRPSSLLATKIREGWVEVVLQMLGEIDALPELTQATTPT